MQYPFKPNCRIQLRLGNFQSKFFRARRKVGSGSLVEDGEAIVTEGRNIFEFYDLADRSVLESANWRLVDDHGLVYKSVWSGSITGRLIRVIAERDPTAERIDLRPIEFGIHPNPFHGIVADTFLGIDASHSLGFRL